MDAPPICGGAIAVESGRVVAVGGKEVADRFAHAQVDDLGTAAVLPGLVNAHVHLELSDCPCGSPPHSFVDWLKSLIARGPTDDSVIAATRAGIAQCHRFGVTTVGDISRQCHLTRPILADSKLRAVSYGELQAMAQRRGLLEERLKRASDTTFARRHLKIGLSPHAPYSIEDAGYRRALQLATERKLPLATHLAETAHENAFLSDHAGPFRELWDFLAAWDERVPKFNGGPIRFAAELGLLQYPTLLAHVNYCDDHELELLRRGRASVVYCPRTHAYFGHPPHRWREMLAAGVNVAVGTDSCASSPDLNLVDDLRLLHRLAPEVEAEKLWKMATISAARALGMEREAGTITRGKWADLTVFPISEGEEPLTGILETDRAPLRFYFEGETG
ncbi:MAG TPA: amidohydrolase family protein [Tepidisphaeraceae bacterium]|nr:amidohydrolase family protein [Tepidisphaeraceae bacterium]